jgi:hypothetical protein
VTHGVERDFHGRTAKDAEAVGIKRKNEAAARAMGGAAAKK